MTTQTGVTSHTVVTKQGRHITVTYTRPLADILADWKADAIRRRYAVPVPKRKGGRQ